MGCDRLHGSARSKVMLFDSTNTFGTAHQKCMSIICFMTKPPHQYSVPYVMLVPGRVILGLGVAKLNECMFPAVGRGQVRKRAACLRPPQQDQQSLIALLRRLFCASTQKPATEEFHMVVCNDLVQR